MPIRIVSKEESFLGPLFSSGFARFHQVPIKDQSMFGRLPFDVRPVRARAPTSRRRAADDMECGIRVNWQIDERDQTDGATS